jgi:hypothetical protein
MLLEKAFAKIYQTYEALEYKPLEMGDVLREFTGNIFHLFPNFPKQFLETHYTLIKLNLYIKILKLGSPFETHQVYKN